MSKTVLCLSVSWEGVALMGRVGEGTICTAHMSGGGGQGHVTQRVYQPQRSRPETSLTSPGSRQTEPDTASAPALKMGSLGHAATMLGLCSLLTVTYVEGDSVLQKPTLDGPNVSLVGAIEVFRCIVSGASQTDAILYELHKENTGRMFGEYTGYYGLPAEFTLQVQVNHEGNWLCRASVQNVSSIPAADSLPQYFRVIEPVEGAELVSDPPSAEVTAGRGLTLTCATRKGTHVSYRWSHNGTQIQASNPKASGNRLRVAEAAPEDAGKYSCLATNGLNDTLVYSASNHTFIRVKVPVSKPRISMAVHKERDVHWATVTCQSATGTPPVSFTFTLPNGTQILQRRTPSTPSSPFPSP
ncbi:hypothetical protein COCON_G00020540 [Conger conger]|uniref:Ig-like domain-containing protein n=1 Tax=Conger conger TaxID=82655 RepID=A0A9Q1DWR7_CONCO|nr:hypothetical protein COCON_G00020540 [Conger conger]